MPNIWLNWTKGENKFRKEIEVHANWTIGDLRNKVLQETGFGFQDQIKILYEGRDISLDGRTLDLINIRDGSALSVLRGSQEKEDNVPMGLLTSSRNPSSLLAGSLLDGQGAPTANDLFEDNEKPHHRLMRRIMFSPFFTGFTLFLALVSLVFFIIGLAKGSPPWLQVLDLVVTILFAAEIVIRITVFPHFWASCFNIFDVILLLVCVIETIVTLAVDVNTTLGIGMLAFRFVVRLIRSIQLLRHQREYSSQQSSINTDVDLQNFDPKIFNLKTFEQIEGDFVSV